MLRVLRKVLTLSSLAVAASGISSCQDNSKPLQLSDLSPAEHQYVERFVVLERARTVALVEAERGRVLLDSLMAAWGDSSGLQTETALSADPRRVAALHELLLRILDSERDSLIQVPQEHRLLAPLPDPPPLPPSRR